jgi:AraC-like DNA-binding protein
MREEKASSDRFMLIGPERVFYAGLLGRPQQRHVGGLGIYAALDGVLEVAVDGSAPRRTEIAIVPAFARHSVTSEHPHVACILVEPETVDRGALRTLTARADDPALAARVRHAYRALRGAPWGDGFTSREFDRLFFEAPLPDRRLDRRIADAAALLRDPAEDAFSASDHARRAGLSLSRFLHLFKAETDVRFRALRAWKRARSLLHFVNRETNLAHLALEIGYPDSTHFSHSIRRFYGLQPREIFSGSRRLDIIRGAPTTAH